MVPEPAVQVDSRTEFGPDIVVAREQQCQGMKFIEPPLLVVEVCSPRTALIDLNLKKSTYEKFGVPCYWIVDPDPERPELTVFEFRDGRYGLGAKATRTITLERPFPVTVALASLASGLHH